MRIVVYTSLRIVYYNVYLGVDVGDFFVVVHVVV
jgi:hypothetical protein